MDEKLKAEIEIFVLENAVKFNGKANPGAIIGKVIGLHKELKDQMNVIGKEISQIVAEINALGLEKQKENNWYPYS